MTWFVIVLICVAFSCIAFVVWRKWIAPWGQVKEVINKSVTVNGRGHF